MIMSERREGWYWIMLDEGWEAAIWNGVSWVIIGSDLTASTDNLRKIGPRIPEPDEPWQCVPVEPTDEMRRQALSVNDFQRGGTSVDEFNSDIYLAMLSAAPDPEDAE